MNATEFSYRYTKPIARLNPERESSVGNVSSGIGTDIKSIDSERYSMLSRINTLTRVDRGISNNLQNMISFTQTREGVLKNASRIVNRISQLATLVTNSLISDSDSVKYIQEDKANSRIKRSDSAYQSAYLASLDLKFNFNLTDITQARGIAKGLENVLINL